MKILAAVLALITAWLLAILCLHRLYRQASLEVCDVIRQHYYLATQPRGQEFDRLCREAADEQLFFYSKSSNIRRINARLSYLRTSHLGLYDPGETVAAWDNLELETGIRAKRVDDYLVVAEVLAESPAARADVRPGDVILTIEGEEWLTPTDARFTSGRFRFRRFQGTAAAKEYDTALHAERVGDNLQPTIADLGARVGLLRLGSFLPQYLDEKKWAVVADETRNYSHLIVDLRGNAGGSFPGMVRALSVFLCQKEWVGSLYHFVPSSERDAAPVVLPDDLDAAVQVRLLDHSPSVEMRAFSGYTCFSGPVVVLIDAGTSSTAEIFAAAMERRKQTDVLGQVSAGEVLMAQWFPIDSLGADYTLSVPIAGFVTADGRELEGLGVHPKRLLVDRLSEALLGKDTMIEDAKIELLKSAVGRHRGQ